MVYEESEDFGQTADAQADLFCLYMQLIYLFIQCQSHFSFPHPWCEKFKLRSCLEVIKRFHTQLSGA